MTSTPALRVAGRLAANVLVLAPATLNALICLFASGMACDDSCTLYAGEGTWPGVPWRDTADAWQWHAIGWLGFASFVFALLFAVSLHLRWRRLPIACFALACVTGLIPWLGLL